MANEASGTGSGVAGSSPSSPPAMQKGGCLPCARLQVPEGAAAPRRARRMVVSRRGSDGVNAEQQLAEMRGQEEGGDGTELRTDEDDGKGGPDHLVIMVNGIVGSASNWKFGAEKFKEKLGERVVIHCSAANAATLTFHGVDVMGDRLAAEVREVIEKVRGVKKISFVSHSLGGLVARYAIAQLYSPPDESLKTTTEEMENEVPVSESQGTIAGLQPMNFITVATPHLGSRGNNQLPFLCGYRCLEKVAICIAHWFVGRTGRHLFLTDGKHGQAPLLRRMVTDCEDGMFMSALRSFKRHVAYANVNYDHMVGWRTASLRRESEMPKIQYEPVDPKYPHIVCVEEALPDNGKITLRSPVAEVKIAPALDPVEEEMISALTQIPWERVDVTFHGSTQRFVAHSTIQVKTYSLHSDGADVIQHMIDNFLV